MEIVIPVIAIVLIVGGALAYIIHAKKSGRHCIGCPNSKECSKKGGCCSCGLNPKNEDKENL